MLTPWRVRLLGDFRAERGGQVVTRFRSRTATALFAYLCLHPGRLFSREELADRFWPDAEVEAGRSSLRVALNSLKKALEPPPDAPGSVIEATREAIRLRPEAVIVDALELERAIKQRRFDDAHALSLGIFLPGFYDEWILDEQARFQALVDSLPESPCPTFAPQPPAAGEIPSITGGQGANKTSQETTGNLPLSLDRFFGRAEELARGLELLQVGRLVTLLGPGGMGKTRTALELAQAASGFPGGAWFVPLADATDPRRVPGALCEALGLSAGSDPLAALGEKLTAKTLVVFDNLEQLGGGAGVEIERLLAKLPELAALVTSRVRLGISGEQVVALGPLALPGPGESLEALSQKPAVALFCDRARASSAEFGLTVRNAESISMLCQQLEGLPLALELAAAWTGTLSVAQMLEKLTIRLALEARRPDREARHLSLRAAIAWSVDLLSPELQKLFQALSVFRGGFVADVAREVADFESIHDGLSRLRGQSLLRADLDGDVPRFFLPEAIREFGQESLTPKARERHALWALREADVRRLSICEEGNVRVVLEYLREQGRYGDFMRLTGQFAFIWFRVGRLQEGVEAFDAALALDSDALNYEDRLPVYRIRGAFYHYQQHASLAQAAAQECMALAQAHGDEITVATMQMDSATVLLIARRFEESLAELQAVLPRLEVLGREVDIDACLHNIGICAIELGQGELARSSLEKALKIARRIESSREEFRIGMDLDMLGRLAVREGDLPRAARLLEEAETTLRRDDHRFYLIFVLQNHAVVRALLGDFTAAREKLAECVPIQKETGSDEGWLDIAEAIFFVRALEGLLTLPDTRLLGACEALRAERGLLPRLCVERENWERTLALGREVLGAKNVEKQLALGAGDSLTMLAGALERIVA